MAKKTLLKLWLMICIIILQFNYMYCIYWKNIGDTYKKIFNNGKLPKILEDDINIHGTEGSNDFLGDIVEFNEYELTENILDIVYHRFNTRQREFLTRDEFTEINVDEIQQDDYDVDKEGYRPGFVIKTRSYGEILKNYGKIPLNINPEGYYYKPHYKIQLKMYDGKIKQGYHTIIATTKYFILDNNLYEIHTSKNYYIEPATQLYFFNKKNRETVLGEVINVNGIQKNVLTIKIDLNGYSINDFILFKPNSEKPIYAYELNDGSGRYIWRDIMNYDSIENDEEIAKYIFTNNAHYINKNIIFYLKRQDPDGRYNLSNSTSNIPIISNFTIDGNTNIYDDVKTIIDEAKEEFIC